MPEQDISDYGQNFIRLQLFTIPGLAAPSPYGGKLREITIDVDPKALSGKGLSAEDVLNALALVESADSGRDGAHRRPRLQHGDELKPLERRRLQ